MRIVSIPKMAYRLKWTAPIIFVLAFVNMTDGMRGISSNTEKGEETSSASRPCNIYSFKRGKFNRLPEPTMSKLVNWSEQAERSAAVSKEIRCNDAYYMLVYLYLTHPQYYTYPDEVAKLHGEIRTQYPQCARKMLMTAFNIAQEDTELDVPWLMYLYVSRIEVHVANDPRKEFQPIMWTSHYGMYELVSQAMFENECTMYDWTTKKERKLPSYKSDLKMWQPIKNQYNRNAAKVIEILGNHWPDLKVNSGLECYQRKTSTSGLGPGVRPVTEEHLTLNALYMTNVFEKVQGENLLNYFGVFENGHELIGYLKEKMSVIKCGRTPFTLYVSSLVDFHEHVQRALKTMMLRIYYDFLDKLAMINIVLRKDLVEQFLKPYKDWCDFLLLSKDDDNFYVSQLRLSNFSDITFSNLKNKVIEKLKENDTKSKVTLRNHQSFENIKIVKKQLMSLAYEYNIPLDPRTQALEDLPEEPVQTTILCVEVLIGYIKIIFKDSNFIAIRSLVKLGTSYKFKQFDLYEQQCPNVSS